jgi:hypothetical protein
LFSRLMIVWLTHVPFRPRRDKSQRKRSYVRPWWQASTAHVTALYAITGTRAGVNATAPRNQQVIAHLSGPD